MPASTLPSSRCSQGSNFEFHYDESSTTGAVLSHILADLASFKAAPWENNPQLVNRLASDAHQYLNTVGRGEANELAGSTAIDDVSIVDGASTRRPVVVDSNLLTKRYFFLSKTARPASHSASATSAPRWSRGCIAQIEEVASPTRRPSLLLLHSFCLRLQNEDPAFIREFVQGHIGFQHMLRMPGQFQSMTNYGTDTDTFKCYRRLSYSFHIPHCILETLEKGTNHPEFPDLKLIEPFTPQWTPAAADQGVKSLCQISSSALLTFFLPETSTSRRQEHDFLTVPGGVLWTLLTVNCIRSRGGNTGTDATTSQPTTAPTPITQFMGAIHDALQTQRADEQNILDALKNRLAESDDKSLFDDKDFTKSHLYHWAIKTCDTVCHSISSTLRFVDRLSEDSVANLNIQFQPHESETPGIEFCERQWMRDVADLEELREQLVSCRKDVQERRNALHGATAVLEARLAIQQGERIKVLTYLAIIYLPLGASASIYSINPLPESATLASFFIVLAAMFLLTAVMGVGMTSIATRAAEASRKGSADRSVQPNSSSSSPLGLKIQVVQQWLRLSYDKRFAHYVGYLEAVLTPPTRMIDDDNQPPQGNYLAIRWRPPATRYWDNERGMGIIYDLCLVPLHHVVIPWMAWPRTLYYRARYERGSWSPLRAVVDTIVIVSSPVSVVLFLLLTALLVCMDGAAWTCHEGQKLWEDLFGKTS
ncbi:hypothetical protein B0H63DRAFT_477377 [Podospora didyma]|uniref:Uncharacterized protein n=1 Tax=Podospora didyma TaxID=330526 RepID=A0AAE0KK67_9PEZI|nr:hypothetical protein B0H63DRAFT_477377 [Podospora didyma]